MTEIECFEDRKQPGDWRAEEVGPDGECYVAIFSGPQAKERALFYRDARMRLQGAG